MFQLFVWNQMNGFEIKGEYKEGLMYFEAELGIKLHNIVFL